MTNQGLVVVTGGSGYIAAFCIRQLLEAGWSVRATVRSLKREAEVRASLGGDLSALSFVEADLTADAGWPEAMKGARYVLHVASPIATTTVKNDDELVIPAREGTLRVLRAARDAGVKRVVMTSSTAAVCYGHGSRAKPFTELEWSDETNLADTSAYERSKTLAERAAWAFIEKEGGALELTTVNPGAVIGPVLGHDYSPSLDIVKKLLDGSVPGVPKLGWALVDVRDIADLHLRAMTAAGAAGQRYLGAGQFYWMRDLATMVKQRLPKLAKRVPSLRIPNFAVRMVALVDPVMRGRLFELDKERHVDTSKALNQLGWKARPVEESVSDCAESLVAHGILRA